MIDSIPKRILRPTAQNRRRQEIERQLAACGLARGPRRLLSGESGLDFEHVLIGRLRVALDRLGPIFSSFGRYMSARADLWPVQNCLELAKISDSAAVTPPNAIRQLLNDEIEGELEDRFLSFEDEPFESRLMFQSHYARLTDDTEVIVKIVHPESEEQFSSDLELLSLLRDSFVGCGLSDQVFKNALADFCQTLRQQLDFHYEMRAFEALAQDVEGYDALYAPQVWGSLSTSRVLVIEKLKGLKLGEVISSLNTTGDDACCRLLRSVGFERNELARLLCEVWLRQALRGRNFLVESPSDNIMILPGKQISLTGGPFAGLPAESQANLWDYLVAAANENSDKACFCLLKEMRKERTSARDNVRQRFRQAMPFRDGGWDVGSDSQSLAELLFVHWRFASQSGYAPLMHLAAFYRGLFGIAELARRIALDSDPLAEGVRDLRLLTVLDEFRKMISERSLVDQMDKYSATMVNLPQNLDEALTLLSESRTPLKSQIGNFPGQRQGNSSTIVIALLLVLASGVLLSHHIAASLSTIWTNRINTIVFIVFGTLLLRAVRRR